VYLAELTGAAVVSDRASWAAAVTGRLRDPDPAMIGAFLGAPPGPGAADWRCDYGEAVAGFLCGYVLDHGAASPLFGIVRRRAAEHALRVPHADAHAAWALATLAALLSGDWLNAREPAGPALVSRGRT